MKKKRGLMKRVYCINKRKVRTRIAETSIHPPFQVANSSESMVISLLTFPSHHLRPLCCMDYALCYSQIPLHSSPARRRLLTFSIAILGWVGSISAQLSDSLSSVNHGIPQPLEGSDQLTVAFAWAYSQD